MSAETKPPNRYALLEAIKTEKGASQQTETLIDYIEEMWETIDLLRKIFGEEQTQEISLIWLRLLFIALMRLFCIKDCG